MTSDETYVNSPDLQMVHKEWLIDNHTITTQAEVQLFATTSVREWVQELIEKGWALSGTTDFYISDGEDVPYGKTKLRAEIWGVPPKTEETATDEPKGYIKGANAGKPREYKPSYVLAAGMSSGQQGCTNCGVVVFDTQAHDNWHERTLSY